MDTRRGSRTDTQTQDDEDSRVGKVARGAVLDVLFSNVFTAISVTLLPHDGLIVYACVLLQSDLQMGNLSRNQVHGGS